MTPSRHTVCERCVQVRGRKPSSSDNADGVSTTPKTKRSRANSNPQIFSCTTVLVFVAKGVVTNRPLPVGLFEDNIPVSAGLRVRRRWCASRWGNSGAGMLSTPGARPRRPWAEHLWELGGAAGRAGETFALWKEPQARGKEGGASNYARLRAVENLEEPRADLPKEYCTSFVRP